MRANPTAAPRVLVTGVGGAPGFDLARSLVRLGCTVIGTDVNPLASGLLLPLIPRVMAPADDPDYHTDLLALCRDLRPDALMPTVEAELTQLIALRSRLEELGVRTWLPTRGAVDACTDKAVFHTVLREHRIPTPRTFLPHQISEVPEGCPLVVKPRRGQGARDVYFCTTAQQATVLCELTDDPIVQEKIVGNEFTADCLVDRAGQASVILRHRLLVRNGLSMVAATFHDEEVTRLVKATLAAIGMVGLCCVQGFLRDRVDCGERVVLTEMNARVAGAFPLAEEAGADLIGQALRGLLGQRVDHGRLAYRAGIYLTKYVETLTAGLPPAWTTAPPLRNSPSLSAPHQ